MTRKDTEKSNAPAGHEPTASAGPKSAEQPEKRSGLPDEDREALEKRIDDPAKAPGGANTEGGTLDTGPDTHNRGMGSNQ